MGNSNAYKHLTLEERRIIQTGISNGSTKTAIGKTLGKDNSTIGKEIKNHRILKVKCSLPMECNAYKKCVHGRKCVPECPDYIPFVCSRRDRSPGACNGCSNWSRCRFDKFWYSPEHADQDYRTLLVDSRVGVNLTSKEAKEIADVVGPLLRQGQSPYAILQAHPELDICEKTLYNYIKGDVFHEVAGITVMDLRRQVSRKITKKKSVQYKKREDRAYLRGRTYRDYEAYMKEHPQVFVCEMDTVYNDEMNGPFIQTFKFLCCGILFAVYQKKKTAQSMVSGLDALEDLLGREVFEKYVFIVLTDRGPEFSAAESMEKRADDTRRTRVFYCDPMQSGQKGSLENYHELLRYICPKKTDLRGIGLVDQIALNTALSHVNSFPVEKMGGRSPLEMAEFMFPDLYEKLVAYGIRKIPKDDVILKPYLLKPFLAD